MAKADPQVQIDSIEKKGDGYAVKLSVTTSDGVTHRCASGAHFTAKDETELKAAITKYADDHEAMVTAAKAAPVAIPASVEAIVGKTVNARTFAEEAKIADPKAVVAEESPVDPLAEPIAPLKG